MGVVVPKVNAKAGLKEAARVFGVLAEPARLRILQLLRKGPLCGQELAKDLNLTPATTCHHLDKLKLANLLSERRAGKHVYYDLTDGELARIINQSLAVLDFPPSTGNEPPAKENRKAENASRRKKPGEVE